MSENYVIFVADIYQCYTFISYVSLSFVYLVAIGRQKGLKWQGTVDSCFASSITLMRKDETFRCLSHHTQKHRKDIE
jgi:hypothetical protein